MPLAAQRGPVRATLPGDPPASHPTADRSISASNSGARNPDDLLGEALRAIEAYRLRFWQTGDQASMPASIEGARDKAQAAYGLFHARGDYGKAAQSLIVVSDVDRMLTSRNPEDLQSKQGPIKQKYAEALSLADQGNNAAMQYKALMGLSRADVNAKDYTAAADSLSRAIDLAARSGNKDDLCNAYEARAELERQRGNLSAASDYVDRALSIGGEVKDATLLWFGYSTRSDIFSDRATQCNYQRDFAFCKRVFDLAMDDTRKALQVAEQKGFGYLKQESLDRLNELQLEASLRTKTAGFSDQLSKLDFYVSKPSQVFLTPRFSAEPNATQASQLRTFSKLVRGASSAYDPRTPFIEGQLDELEGNADGALQNYLRAVELIESDRRNLGDTQGSGSFLSDRIEIYYRAALQHLDRKQYPRAFDLIERSRARAMAELLASRELSLRTPELQDLYSRSVALKAQIGKAQNQLFDTSSSNRLASEDLRNLQARVDALQVEDRALELTVQQRAPKLAELSGSRPRVSLEAAQAAAQRGNYDLLYYLTLESGTVIWHIGGDSVHVLKVYYTRPLLANDVAALRKGISDSQSTFDERVAVELFLELVNPVLPYIRTHHLVIVPHEDLANVPFQVLKNPEDGSYLGERYQISYAPSATVLAGLTGRPDFTHGQLLAIADPGMTNAVGEVNAIGRLYFGRAKIVTDALASKQSLKTSLTDYNLLHLSVHGVFEANNPLLSYLKLRPAGTDDGRLTAAEMFGLSLPANSLVVLSACETGRVEATHGNDVLGMVPALLFAGAGTLVLSSWTVDAQSTAAWMETFYSEARTKPPSEAARLALVAVKKQPGFQHPFYWAPFMLTGQ